MGTKITAAQAQETVGRRELAKLFRLHPDTITRLLHSGLAASVVRWGGHGAEMRFSLVLACRWFWARECQYRRPWCETCAAIREDCQSHGDHLVRARHGVFKACESCRPRPAFRVGCDFTPTGATEDT